MHGHYEDITNMECTLTEPSHLIGGQDQWGDELWLAPLRKPRRGDASFDHTFVLIAGSWVSQQR